MDIRAFAKQMSEFGRHPQPRDTIDSFLRRYRKMKSMNWSFWQVLIGVLRETMRAALKAPLLSSWKVALCLGALIVHFFIGVTTQNFLVVRKASLNTEVSRRGTPKLFIPIPKIETGGCARSDSLVRSLIF